MSGLTMLQSGGISLLGGAYFFRRQVGPWRALWNPFFSKFKVFMTVSPKSIKPMKLSVFDLNQILFIFISSNKRVTNQSMPLYPDVVFINSLRVCSLVSR